MAFYVVWYSIRTKTPGTSWWRPQPSSTPWPTLQTTSTNGASGPGPRSRRPGTPPPWPIYPHAGGRHTGVLGTRPLHPARGRPGRGCHHLAWRADHVLCNPGRFREGHPPGQRDHHDAPGQAREDPGGRDHTGPRYQRQDGQSRVEDRRNEAGPGLGPAGLPPPFDTGGPQGPLHDGGASLLMAGANFANFANFPRRHPPKLAPMVNCAWRSAAGGPDISITST